MPLFSDVCYCIAERTMGKLYDGRILVKTQKYVESCAARQLWSFVPRIGNEDMMDKYWLSHCTVWEKMWERLCESSSPTQHPNEQHLIWVGGKTHVLFQSISTDQHSPFEPRRKMGQLSKSLLRCVFYCFDSGWYTLQLHPPKQNDTLHNERVQL